MKRISIVIPTFNRKKLLFNTLNQIKSQINNIKTIRVFFIIIVDGSTDGTLEMLKIQFPEVHIVEGTGNWWYTKSMNAGFKYAEQFNPDFVLALNDDVILEGKYLKNLLEVSERIGKEAIIGSFSYLKTTHPKVFFSGIKKINTLTFKQYPYLKRLSEINLKEIQGIFPSKTLPGRGMLIPFKILKELNYFDEHFPQYGSDDDFVLRAWGRGYKAFVSYDCRIISLPEYTSQGAAINKPSFYSFIKNLLINKYASNYFFKECRKIYRHGNKLFLPFTVLYQFFAIIKSYFKYKYFLK